MHSCRAGEQGQRILGRVSRVQTSKQVTNGSDMKQLFQNIHRRSFNDREDPDKVECVRTRIKKSHLKTGVTSLKKLQEFQDVLKYHEQAYFCSRNESTNDSVYERELESLRTGQPNLGPKSGACAEFRWTEQSFIDVQTLKHFFASWNFNIEKSTKRHHPSFYSVWMNTGYCPQVKIYNPCTGKNSTTMEVFYGEEIAQLCIPRGEEKEDDLLILTGSEEEAASRDDEDFIEIEDVPLRDDVGTQ